MKNCFYVLRQRVSIGRVGAEGTNISAFHRHKGTIDTRGRTTIKIISTNYFAVFVQISCIYDVLDKILNRPCPSSYMLPLMVRACNHSLMQPSSKRVHEEWNKNLQIALRLTSTLLDGWTSMFDAGIRSPQQRFGTPLSNFHGLKFFLLHGDLRGGGDPRVDLLTFRVSSITTLADRGMTYPLTISRPDSKGFSPDMLESRRKCFSLCPPPALCPFVPHPVIALK